MMKFLGELQEDSLEKSTKESLKDFLNKTIGKKSENISRQTSAEPWKNLQIISRGFGISSEIAKGTMFW